MSLRGGRLSFGGGRRRSWVPRRCCWVAGCRLWAACRHCGWWACLWEVDSSAGGAGRSWVGADVRGQGVVIQAWGAAFSSCCRQAVSWVWLL